MSGSFRSVLGSHRSTWEPSAGAGENPELNNEGSLSFSD